MKISRNVTEINKEYPKTLIITSSNFNSYTGTGILLKNLFCGWPKDRLAMAYYDNYDSDSNDKSICTNYYGLGNKEKKFIWPVSKFVKNQQKQQSADPRRPAL